MAFKPGQLDQAIGSRKGFSTFIYEDEAHTLAEMTAQDFFLPALDTLDLNDWLLLTGSDGGGLARINAISASAIDLTDAGFTGGAPSPTEPLPDVAENLIVIDMADTDTAIVNMLVAASPGDVFLFPGKTYGQIYLKPGPTGLPNSGGIIFNTKIANNGPATPLPNIDPMLGEYITLRALDPDDPPIFTKLDERKSSLYPDQTAAFRFEGLHFHTPSPQGAVELGSEYTRFTDNLVTFDGTLSDYMSWTASQWTPLNTGTARAIKIGGNRMTVARNKIRVTWEGITLPYGSEFNIVEENEINGISGDAFSLSAGNNIVRNNLVRNICFDGSGNHPDGWQLRNLGTPGEVPQGNNAVYGNVLIDADIDHPNPVRTGIVPSWSNLIDFDPAADTTRFAWGTDKKLYECNIITGPGSANASDPVTDGGVIWNEAIAVPAYPQGFFVNNAWHFDMAVYNNLVYTKANHGIEGGAGAAPALLGYADNNAALESYAGDVKPPNAWIAGGAGSPTTATYLGPFTTYQKNIYSDIRVPGGGTDNRQVRFEDYGTEFIDLAQSSPLARNFHRLETVPAGYGPIQYQHLPKVSAGGADTAITSPACSALRVTDALTLEYRINLALNVATTIFAHDSEDTRVIIQTDGTIAARLNGAPATSSAAGAVTASTWTTILVVLDGAGQELRVYVDGTIAVTEVSAAPMALTSTEFLEFFPSDNSAANFTLNYVKAWREIDTVNYIAPRGIPMKIIQGTPSEVNADAWFSGADAFV